MAEQWLSIVEYARATGTSDMTIRRRIRTGKIRADLRDGKYFIAISVDQANGLPQSLQNHSQSYQQASDANALVKNRVASNHTNERAIPLVRRPEDLKQSNHYQVSPNYIGPQNVVSTNHSNHSTNNWKAIPGTVTGPLVDAGMASVEARALIEFCDRALHQASSTVQAIEGKYSARLDALNAQLNTRHQEINSLNQQIEDLQLLVQILERKRV